MNLRVTALGVVILVLAGIGIAMSQSGSDDPEASSRSLPVRSMTLQAADSYQQQLEYTGTVMAGQTTELGFQRMGRITELLVDDGRSVGANDVIARLDTRELEAEKLRLTSQRAEAVARLDRLKNGPRKQTIDAAKARVRSLEAQLALDKSNLQRRTTLFKSRASSQEDVDRSRFGSQSTQALLDEAKHSLDELQEGSRFEDIEAQKSIVAQFDAALQRNKVDFEDSVLRSPFRATVTKRYLDEGAVVSVGQAVVRLVGQDRREAHIGIPSEVALETGPHSNAKILVSGQSWDATLRTVLPELDASTRTQTAVYEVFANASGQQPVPGEIARVHLPRSRQASGFWVSSNALQRGQRGLWSVFVIEQDEQSDHFVERRDVEILFNTADRAYIRGTISPGERVVSGGVHRLVGGQRVEVIEASQQP